jgi:hypothetical protein
MSHQSSAVRSCILTFTHSHVRTIILALKPLTPRSLERRDIRVEIFYISTGLYGSLDPWVLPQIRPPFFGRTEDITGFHVFNDPVVTG